jgi:hypothetical protein
MRLLHGRRLTARLAALLTRLGHYYSTWCMHGLHHQCKAECKRCAAPCRCRCHR